MKGRTSVSCGHDTCLLFFDDAGRSDEIARISFQMNHGFRKIIRKSTALKLGSRLGSQDNSKRPSVIEIGLENLAHSRRDSTKSG